MNVSTPPPSTPLTPAEATKILTENFAPWIQSLNLKVEQTTPTTTVRLPWNEALAREGGTLSGQALMAAADTATVLAISAARGGYCPMTTVQQNTTFQRPIKNADVLITARVTKLGRTLAFTDVVMTPTAVAREGSAAGAGPGAAEASASLAGSVSPSEQDAEPPTAPEADLTSPAAHATTVYAILG